MYAICKFVLGSRFVATQLIPFKGCNYIIYTQKSETEYKSPLMELQGLKKTIEKQDSMDLKSGYHRDGSSSPDYQVYPGTVETKRN